MQRVRISQRPVASARGSSETKVDHLAPDLHPCMQKPIWSQALRPSRGTALIATLLGP